MLIMPITSPEMLRRIEHLLKNNALTDQMKMNYLKHYLQQVCDAGTLSEALTIFKDALQREMATPNNMQIITTELQKLDALGLGQQQIHNRIPGSPIQHGPADTLGEINEENNSPEAQAEAAEMALSSPFGIPNPFATPKPTPE